LTSNFLLNARVVAALGHHDELTTVVVLRFVVVAAEFMREVGYYIEFAPVFGRRHFLAMLFNIELNFFLVYGIDLGLPLNGERHVVTLQRVLDVQTSGLFPRGLQHALLHHEVVVDVRSANCLARKRGKVLALALFAEWRLSLGYFHLRIVAAIRAP